jgi:hypothetical protein
MGQLFLTVFYLILPPFREQPPIALADWPATESQLILTCLVVGWGAPASTVPHGLDLIFVCLLCFVLTGIVSKFQHFSPHRQSSCRREGQRVWVWLVSLWTVQGPFPCGDGEPAPKSLDGKLMPSTGCSVGMLASL